MHFLIAIIWFITSAKSEICGNIFTEKQFVLTSENYPLPYPNDKQCFYLLKGLSCTKQFQIEFLDFDLPKTIGCVKDRLEIGNQDALCGLKNGSKIYFSERGLLKLKFVSNKQDEVDTRRGFRLFVTRIDEDGCEEEDGVNNNVFPEKKINTTILTKPTYLPPVSNPCCLNNIFTNKNFLLTSPNFPYSINQAKNCTFIIRKFSSSVCRLRIHILFFNLGPVTVTQSICPFGYLKIDGKLICGCNSDLRLTIGFYEENKFLNFISEGRGIDGASGFVLEVIQDECQKRYEPEAGFEKLTKNNFRFYNDQTNRIQFPNIDQLKLIQERNYENKHVYFYAPEDEMNYNDETILTQEKEETFNNIDLSSINNNILTDNNIEQCLKWNTKQLAMLQKRYGQSLTQMCKFTQEHNENNCIVLRDLVGSFQSPGYPDGTYPADRNVCFSFKLSPGYCTIKIYFEDFDIERSYDCLKDYLSVDQYRYCGDYLKNRQVTLNPLKPIMFVSDANYCGKGFTALYQQLQCQTTYHNDVNNNSIRPSFNCNHPAVRESTDDNNSPLSCGKVFADKYFIIRQNEFGNGRFCVYVIRKHNKNICKLRLNFDQFNIPCDVVWITINGRKFCGQNTGKSVIIPMLDNVSIIYTNDNGQYLRPDALFIRAEQIDTECDDFIPEAARVLKSKNHI